MLEPSRIIAVEPLHAPVLAALHEQCFEDAWSADSIAGLLATPGAFALVAFTAADPAAFVLCRVAGDECEVLALGVVPASRRAGLATSLLDAALADAFGRGARRVFLEVAEDNRAARSLYSGHGFVDVGRRPGYYPGSTGSGTDAMVLSRDLGA